MSAPVSARTQPLVSDDRVKQTMQRLLYAAVHVEKRFSAVQIAQEAGVSYNTVSSYMTLREDAQRQPSLGAALSIAVVLGERGVNTILALIGYGGATPLDEVDAPRPSVAVADALSRLAVLASASAENGRIDPSHEGMCRDAADIIITDILPFSSAGRAV